MRGILFGGKMRSMKNCFYKGAVPFISETPPTPSPLKAVALKIGFSTRKRAFFYNCSAQKKLDSAVRNLIWGQNRLNEKLFLRRSGAIY